MCKLKSAIILKNKIFMPDYDSHGKMLEELGIADDYLNASKTFIRAELSPENSDPFTDIDTWKFRVDQDITPDWFTEDEYKPLMVEKVKEWAKYRIHIGVKGLKVDCGENHYIKDCKDVEVCGSATIQRVCGSATIQRVCGSATIQDVYDSATIQRVYGSATIQRVYGSATIQCVCGSATIQRVCDSATVVSYPYSRWSNADKIILCENATFKDAYAKTIYQAGDWKLVEVKNGSDQTEA